MKKTVEIAGPLFNQVKANNRKVCVRSWKPDQRNGDREVRRTSGHKGYGHPQ
jgi:hypothetical protein